MKQKTYGKKIRLLSVLALLLLAIALAAAACAPAPAETGTDATFSAASFQPNGGEYRKITPEDASDWLADDQPPLLLDVRTLEEYAERHIAGSVLIPVTELEARADELPADPDAPVVVYCRSGRRSAEAAGILFSLGYTNVYDLGGIISWPYDTVASD